MMLSSVTVLSAQSDTVDTSILGEIDTLELLTLIQQEVVNNLDRNHIDPPKIDDQFSTILFSNWIDIVDPDKIYYFESEMKQLGLSLYDLDDQLKANDFSFFEQSYALLQGGIQRNLRLLNALMQSDMDFSIQEDYTISGSNNTYIKDTEEHRLRFNKYAKYEVLQIFNSLLAEASQADNEAAISKDTLLELAKEEFYNLEKGRFKLLSIKDKINYYEDYLDAVARSYDPYCEYYSELEKQEYDVNLTGKVVGVGIYLNSVHGKNTIIQVADGGPAWNTGQIEAGDIIVGVTSQNDEYYDATDASTLELASKIRGRVGTNLTMHLIGRDSIAKDVRVYREEVLTYGEQVKGLMLSQETGKPIGYIDIRKFYKSKSPGKHSSSAEDAINHFKIFENTGVNSVVIDLRDCVGGALEESLAILGALIGEGPLLQSKDRRDSLHIYHSTSDERVYTGDIIVLTNQNSASAAEILASTLQDYNRAIVMGTRTFGKGTVQRFDNLSEHAMTQLSEPNHYGWLKYTFSKYYRVNGDATQLVGVEPDIMLPGILDSVAVIETQMKNPILWSQIDPVVYEKCQSYDNDLRMLQIMSKIRVTSSLDFKNVKKAAIDLKELYSQTTIPLNMSDYRVYDHMRNLKLRNASNAPYSDKPLMEVTTASLTQKLSLSLEESRWMALRSQDIYLNEAINVFADLQSTR